MGDRKAALLTNTHREYVWGERDLENSEHDRALRSRLRNRIINGILDFKLLQDHLDDSEIRKIVESFDSSEPDDVVIDEPASALRATVAFVYRLAEESDLDPEKIIEEGAKQGREGRLELIRRKLDGEPGTVTLNELGLLWSSGEISEEEYTELFQSALTGSGGKFVVPDDMPNPFEITYEDKTKPVEDT